MVFILCLKQRTVTSIAKGPQTIVVGLTISKFLEVKWKIKLLNFSQSVFNQFYLFLPSSIT